MKTETAIIGGSGFYSLLDDAKKANIKTEYGMPSAPISIGKINGKTVAFLPRHGIRHMLPPHKVPYKANIAALAKLGVTRIIATNAVGSLSAKFKPGDFTLFDQFVDMTQGRDDTFYHGAPVTHISVAEPYCSQLKMIAANAAGVMKLKCHSDSTVVVINGPRFSTKAESRFYSSQGFDVINMTQYPEVALARELGMCYLGVGTVTDYDAGLEGKRDIKPVSSAEVSKIFARNIDKAKKLVMRIVNDIPEKRLCGCSRALDGAVLNP